MRKPYKVSSIGPFRAFFETIEFCVYKKIGREACNLPGLFVYPKNKGTKKSLEPERSKDFSGAATRIRTGDLILTKDALYQLSYSSIYGDPERARTVDL